MPEFVLEGRDHAARAESEFVLGFIEAMFFTNEATGTTSDEWWQPEVQKRLEEGQLGGEIPCDMGYTDLHPDSLAAIRKFCQDWQDANAALLAEAYQRDYSEAQAGRDLWFTSQGHGVGYWDRKELDADNLGDRLSEATERSDINPFFGRHVTYGNAPFVHVDF